VPFKLANPEVGFTSDVIRDPRRFVGRSDLIQDCVAALNAKQGLLAVYGKRGVGKSSLLRQVQQIATGNYALVHKAGLGHLIPERPRRYYTVYYSCDAIIDNAQDLVKRLCNDTDPEDGLLRLVPDQGKELQEFSRTSDTSVGQDLKVLNWGKRGADAQKYASAVPSDVIQSFRNFTSAVVDANNRMWSRRDAVLILLDEFDVIKDKTGLGSLIKSLSSPTVKFGVCGIGQDLGALISDHKSVARLIEQGAIHVRPMSLDETAKIFETAKRLFDNIVHFDTDVVLNIAEYSEGYPYFAQLIGKGCVDSANKLGTNRIDNSVLNLVLDNIKNGKSFPNFEQQYQLAVGNSEDRAMLLALLAEQKQDTTTYDATVGQVVIKRSRSTAQELGIEYIDQLLPRLVEERYGPILVKIPDHRGLYEFADPVFRAYVRLRNIGARYR
jgi:Cdc6-like AAA superfamily ATPase